MLPADTIVLPPEPIALVNVLAQQPILRLISCLQHKLLISLLAARRWRLVEADGGASTEAPQGDTSQPVISSLSPHSRDINIRFNFLFYCCVAGIGFRPYGGT